MKKILTLLLTILSLTIVSCSDQPDLSEPDHDVEHFSPTSHRTIRDAINIANRLRKNYDSRAWNPITESDVSVICSDAKSRSNSTDTLFYVVNYGNDQGFAIISAPYNVEPILAMVEDGSYGSEETNSNENFQIVLDATKSYISAKLDTTLHEAYKFYVEDIELPRPDTLYYNTIRTKRISVAWNQYWPENIYCPNKVAGCGPIAIAQICSFFEEPKSLTLTFSNKDQSSLSLDWSEIKKHVHSSDSKNIDDIEFEDHYYFLKCTLESDYNLARFVRQIGHDCDANYKGSTTSVDWNKSKSVLKKYLSTRTFTTLSSSNDVYNFLRNRNGVVLLAGGNHMWVCDGVLYFGYAVTQYSMNDTNTGYTSSTTLYTHSYIHMNLGWNGHCNGYYASTIFKPDNAYEYDSPYSNETEYSFTSGFKYLFVE